MKKIGYWTAGGLAVAVACGFAGLHHLSASVVTLTVFCAVQAMLFYVLTRGLGFIWSLPDRIAAWVGVSEVKGGVE